MIFHVLNRGVGRMQLSWRFGARWHPGRGGGSAEASPNAWTGKGTEVPGARSKNLRRRFNRQKYRQPTCALGRGSRRQLASLLSATLSFIRGVRNRFVASRREWKPKPQETVPDTFSDSRRARRRTPGPVERRQLGSARDGAGGAAQRVGVRLCSCFQRSPAIDHPLI
jgi:hypothetical protein